MTLALKLSPSRFSNERLNDLHRFWRAEGWDIFLAEGSVQNDTGRRPYQLQRCDETDIFAGDKAAWEHVIEKAWNGSQPHLDALAFLKDCSPEEYCDLLLLLPRIPESTPGQRAYEEDVRRKPAYHDDQVRHSWEHLDRAVQENWEASPFPRIW